MKSLITILTVCAIFFSVTNATAQLINLKTAPVATGDQFMVQPAVNAGMGNVSIALDDTLGDPFVNPAKARKLNGMHVYMFPTFYHISDGIGGARTLTVGGLTTGDEWFGGLGVAVQELDLAPTGSNRLKDKSANNNYVWAEAGKRINTATSWAASLFWAGLGAMDGVDLLYPNSERIDQHGHMLDLRLGLNGETNNRGDYEALLLFNRIDMTHEVTYPTAIPLYYDYIVSPQPYLNSNTEENMDRTNTWGLHVGYDQPVGENDWRLGGIFTFNYKSHPKIPNYDLMNIPRDPGNSRAFNMGLGTAHRSEDNVTFAVDVIFEPVWSNTWAAAEQDIYNPAGTVQVIKKGEKTVRNDFEFMNSVLKTGLGWKGENVLLQAGIQAKTYRYRLKQKDYVQGTYRRQREHWTEWNFSLSLGVILKSLDIRYTGLLTTGTGQPGTVTGWGRPVMTAGSFLASGSDYIFAPDGDLALNNATVLTHQITVIIPM